MQNQNPADLLNSVLKPRQKTADRVCTLVGGLLGKLMSLGIVVTLILGIQKAITVPYSWFTVFFAGTNSPFSHNFTDHIYNNFLLYCRVNKNKGEKS